MRIPGINNAMYSPLHNAHHSIDSCYVNQTIYSVKDAGSLSAFKINLKRYNYKNFVNIHMA